MGNRVIRIDSSGGKRPQVRGQSSLLVHYSKHYGMAGLAKELFRVVKCKALGRLWEYIQPARIGAALRG